MKSLLFLTSLILSSISFAKMPSPAEQKSMPRMTLSEKKAANLDVCIGGSMKIVLDSSVEEISTMNQSNLDSFWTSISDNNRTVFMELGPKVVPGDGTVLSLYKSDVTKYLVNIKAVNCKSEKAKEVVLTK